MAKDWKGWKSRSEPDWEPPENDAADDQSPAVDDSSVPTEKPAVKPEDFEQSAAESADEPAERDTADDEPGTPHLARILQDRTEIPPEDPRRLIPEDGFANIGPTQAERHKTLLEGKQVAQENRIKARQQGSYASRVAEQRQQKATSSLTDEEIYQRHSQGDWNDSLEFPDMGQGKESRQQPPGRESEAPSGRKQLPDFNDREGMASPWTSGAGSEGEGIGELKEILGEMLKTLQSIDSKLDSGSGTAETKWP